VGLREDIEAALGDAAAEGGVRQLAIDGDEKVWVAGVGATDGTLEVRVADRGPRHGLSRRRPDRDAMRALGFRDAMEDAWILPVPAGTGQAARAAAAAVSALVDGLGVADDARAEPFFTQRGAKDVGSAVQALSSGAEELAFVDRVGGGNALTLMAVDGHIRVQALWPGDEPLELPGFRLDRDDKVSTRDVEPGEAVATAQSAWDALGVRAGDPLFIHLGA
jgi:hypothetical protein